MRATLPHAAALPLSTPLRKRPKPVFDQLKNLGGLGNIMGIASELPKRIDDVQKRLDTIRETGSAGGGMVEVDADGKGNVLAVRVSPEAFSGEDPQVIQDLFLAAANDALTKTKKAAAGEIEQATSDLPIPGLSDTLKKFTGNA